MSFPYFGILRALSILAILPAIQSIDSSCDFEQEMTIGKEYYIYNTEYPRYYQAGTSCRWIGRSDPGTLIVITCEDIFLPDSSNCEEDGLYISRSGDTEFRDASVYCGQQTITIMTEYNAISIGLFASNYSPGGRFSCALTAIQVEPPSTTTPGPDNCDCGWKLETKIVGGHDTGVNEYPFMAVIVSRNTGDAFCGAPIISEYYALTAAHCLHHQQPSDLGLIVGDHDLSTGTDTKYAAIYRIADFKIHSEYVQATETNDIAILKTATPIVFSFYVGPICLPFRFTLNDFYAQTVTALGWGFLDFSGNKSEILQEVDLSIVDINVCKAAMTDPVTNNQICTYAPKKDTCLSDSGGPIIWKDYESGRLQLIGIISYGIGCATKKPAVNTRITSYLPWILSETTDATYCIK